MLLMEIQLLKCIWGWKALGTKYLLSNKYYFILFECSCPGIATDAMVNIWKHVWLPSIHRSTQIYRQCSRPSLIKLWNFPINPFTKAGIILYMRPANERRRYSVTSSLIGWAHTQNDPTTRSATVSSKESILMTSCNSSFVRPLNHIKIRPLEDKLKNDCLTVNAFYAQP